MEEVRRIVLVIARDIYIDDDRQREEVQEREGVNKMMGDRRRQGRTEWTV